VVRPLAHGLLGGDFRHWRLGSDRLRSLREFSPRTIFRGLRRYQRAVHGALTEEVIGAGLAPTTRIWHRLITSIGFNRNSLELTGVLVSGLIRLVLFVVAAGLVLAPWGLQRSYVPINFGVQVGDVTISPFNIFIAIGLFALTFGIFHAVLQWVDSKLLPHMNFDLGLRNSIRTSLGYLGFLIAAGLALGYLGLNYEKFAIVAGALSVGIGFGLQSIVNNFVSGLILLWERAVRVGGLLTAPRSSYRTRTSSPASSPISCATTGRAGW
jgi:small-conductance mechanosensitive channel